MAKRFCYSPDHRVALSRNQHSMDFANAAISALENELHDHANSINKDNNDLESVLHDVYEINNNLKMIRDYFHGDDCCVTHDVILITLRFILMSGHVDHELITYTINLLLK